jgi:hypothetical protein
VNAFDGADEHGSVMVLPSGDHDGQWPALPISTAWWIFVVNPPMECPIPLVTGLDWLWGAFAFIVAMVLTVVLPVQGTKKRENVHPLTVEELNEFHMVDSLKARGVI